jgi:hypothetical protein
MNWTSESIRSEWLSLDVWRGRHKQRRIPACLLALYIQSELAAEVDLTTNTREDRQIHQRNCEQPLACFHSVQLYHFAGQTHCNDKASPVFSKQTEKQHGESRSKLASPLESRSLRKPRSEPGRQRHRPHRPVVSLHMGWFY